MWTPDLAREAAEENRHEAGQNVIDVVGAQISEFRASVDTRFAELRSENAEIRAEIKSQGARIQSIESCIDDLRQVIWRVIWPLIILLAAPIFGLLYKILTG